MSTQPHESCSLSQRIQRTCDWLEAGDGGVRQDLDAALAEVDANAAAAASWRAVVDAYESARFTDEANEALVAAFIQENDR